ISDLDALRPRFIIGASAAGTVSYLLLYLLAPFWVSPLYIATSIVVMAATLMVTRAIAVTVTRSGHFRRRVLVIGSEGQADAIRALCEAPGSGTEFVGRYDLERRLPGHLGYYVEHRDVAEIVIADPQDRSALPMGALLDCKMNGARVHDVAEFYERESGRVDLDRVSVDRFVFGTGFNLTHSELLLKRAIDILGSFAGLIVLSPLLAATALAIRWHDGGPVFYRQTRVGYRGARFEILKFRSMRTDAEKFGAQWASEDDPRITPIGRFIRKCRIDELPQLVNILLGDMSIVGPRPERPVFVADLNRSIRHYDDRHRMKPGLTGWAQINDRYGASVDDARSKLAYDLYYLKHFSLWLDLLIMLKTIRVVVWTDSAR
ncbi:MAG: TIGR03013 family XrtA/PEP-CTERM system glycosyltransferase, partial [Pseudomonadota bacterium]